MTTAKRIALLETVAARASTFRSTLTHEIARTFTDQALAADIDLAYALNALEEHERAVSGAIPLTEFSPAVALSDDQSSAWSKLESWVRNAEPYFVLRGFAGTGKTFLMRKLAELTGLTIFFTAPTNKASKVLSVSVGRPTKTVYSALGIRMRADEDRLVLDYGDELPYFPANAILVVDEASMLNQELVEFIEKVRKHYGLKVLYVGDPAQLNPIGETSSPCWKVTTDKACRAVLRKVMRYDNKLLALSMQIRECIKTKNYRTPLTQTLADGKEIIMTTEDGFLASFVGQPVEHFQNNKVIAWRNKTVDRYTAAIRKNLGFGREYEVSELVMLAAPMEENGVIVAHTDEEFRVVKRGESKQRVRDAVIPVYVLAVEGDTNQTLHVPVAESELDIVLSDIAREAREAEDRKSRAKLWREFWDAKGRFQKLRYAYALTAHRAQGSTFNTVYLDQSDILANRVKREAYRCFYVGATRASHSLISF